MPASYCLEIMMTVESFQHGKHNHKAQLTEEQKSSLPELSDPVFRERLIKAYRRIEAEYQRLLEQRQSNIR